MDPTRSPKNENEPTPQFRVDFRPLELPFTCTLSGEPQTLATFTALQSGYVTIDPASRQAIFVVINDDEVISD